MKTPDDYLGSEVKADVNELPVTIINTDADEKLVYCHRFEPRELGGKEHRQFHLAGAFAYEIYVICSNNRIDDINYRIAQTPCAHHSHAPHGAPARLFPEGAMFDIDWEEIIPPVRKRILDLLDAFIRYPGKLKKATTKRTPKAVKE